MSDRERPAPDEIPEHLKQRREDFAASSPEMQEEIQDRDESEAWDLYEQAHDLSREEALAEARTRLHRLGEQGIEVTPQIEARELKHVEDTLHVRRPVRGAGGRFAGSESFDVATASGLDAGVDQQEKADSYEQSSDRTKGRIDRADKREEFDIEQLAVELRRKEALTAVENRIARTTEQGARWWPWEKLMERRKATNALKGETVSQDWLAYAQKYRRQQLETYREQGEPVSETRRAVDASWKRIKKTWDQRIFPDQVVRMPVRIATELVRLAWQGAKRSRKEYRVRESLSGK